jgi:hypothetical protein
MTRTVATGDLGARQAGPDGAAASGPAPPTPRAVVLTMTRDEGPMLARWVRHYGAQVGVENLLVLDDGSTDGSTDALPCTVHRLPPVPAGRRFEMARMELVSGLAQGLLAYYDVVVFVDVDELLVPDPDRYDGLLEYLAARADTDVVAPVTLNVVHHVRSEGPLDPHLPVLGQRRFVKFVPHLCKPCVKRVPAPWLKASHGIRAPFAVDPALFMIHLKFHDVDVLRDVATRRRRMVAHDGRGFQASWAAEVDDLVALLEEIGTTDPETAREFRVPHHALDDVVLRDGDLHVARPPGQLTAMRRRPLRRVPDRLLGRV